MPKQRAVMDTNVLFAAFYSRTGASFEIIQRFRRDNTMNDRAVYCRERFRPLCNDFVHEYAEILERRRCLI